MCIYIYIYVQDAAARQRGAPDARGDVASPGIYVYVCVYIYIYIYIYIGSGWLKG